MQILNNANINGRHFKNPTFRKKIGPKKKIKSFPNWSGKNSSKFKPIKEIKLIVRDCTSSYKSDKGLKWALIAKEVNQRKVNKGCIRLGKHCRERWMNNLDPSLSK